jgi:hypothetical protein
MNDELGMVWKRTTIIYLKIFQKCLERLRKAIRNVTKDRQILGWDSNLSSLKYKAGTLTIIL